MGLVTSCPGHLSALSQVSLALRSRVPIWSCRHKSLCTAELSSSSLESIGSNVMNSSNSSAWLEDDEVSTSLSAANLPGAGFLLPGFERVVVYFGSSLSPPRVNRDPWPVSSGGALNLSSLGGPTGAWVTGCKGVRLSVCNCSIGALPSPLEEEDF